MLSLKNIKDYNLLELEQIILNLGYQKFNARQIFSWIYKKQTDDFDKMSDLPAGLRDLLKKNFIYSAVFVKDKLQSKDGTRKLLFELPDGNLIEGVIIPSDKRVTGCISSQAGCKYNCSFCASGSAGFKRNLTAAEIIDEVLYLKKNSQDNRLTHLVFMGTGEPFDNYANVLKAVRIINSADGLNIGARRITISTSGLIPGIEKLAKENRQIELAISLHAADDKIRSSIMPVNKIYPLKELIKACRDYTAKTNRQITFEYILIKDINSDLQSAKKLSILLKGLNCKVNLIPANTVWEFKTKIASSAYGARLRNDTCRVCISPPEKKDILLFREALLKLGINVTLRRPRGQDIEAACGQLRLKYENKKISV